MNFRVRTCEVKLLQSENLFPCNVTQNCWAVEFIWRWLGIYTTKKKSLQKLQGTEKNEVNQVVAPWLVDKLYHKPGLDQSVAYTWDPHGSGGGREDINPKMKLYPSC